MFDYNTIFDGTNWLYNHEFFHFLYGGYTPGERAVFVPAKVRKVRDRNRYSIEDRYNSVFYKTYFLPSSQDDSPIHDISTTLAKHSLCIAVDDCKSACLKCFGDDDDWGIKRNQKTNAWNICWNRWKVQMERAGLLSSEEVPEFYTPS